MKYFFFIFGFFIFHFKKLLYFLEKEYIKSKLKLSGKNLRIGNNCRFSSNIAVGKNVFIGSNCIFQSNHGKIKIGNNVMFGPGVHIHGGDHVFNYDKNHKRYEIPKANDEDGLVEIEDDVWVGANAIILKGVKIGKGAIIGAGTIVSFDVPPFTKVYGAKPLVCKKIFNE